MQHKPTDSELEILQILWDMGPSTVRSVHEELTKSKESGYTTTLKIMQIMTDKGFTQRDTSAKTHIYTAVAKEGHTKNDLVKRFVSSTFKGSTSQLILSALGNHKTSKSELQEIKNLIQQIELDGNLK